MSIEAHLWLIRHAPVDGPRGVIHGPDAPADVSDSSAFAALKARLPPQARAVCSPASGPKRRPASILRWRSSPSRGWSAGTPAAGT